MPVVIDNTNMVADYAITSRVTMLGERQKASIPRNSHVPEWNCTQSRYQGNIRYAFVNMFRAKHQTIRI